MAFSVANIAQSKAFRISPTDTNYFVMLFDEETDKIDNIFVIEIFRTGGATPPNEHARAHEFFHVLHGEGVARCEGQPEACDRSGRAGRKDCARNDSSVAPA